MSKASRWSLIWPVLATIVVPLIAAWFAYPDTHLPPGFGVFPPELVQENPKFWLPYFAAMALVCAVIALFLLFPTLFGFQKVEVPPAPKPTTKLPIWFWIGTVFWAFFLWLMWARTTIFGDLVYYAFSPMWWGFILMLDGWVYRRNNGRSLMSSNPTTFWISALVSVFGWLYFEYYDYFVLSNWYYPNGHDMPNLTHATIVVLFLIAYSTVWPVIFEWYNLLQTFPKLVARYSQGPKLSLPGGLLIVAGLALVGLMVFLPLPLFWVVWIGPMIVIVGQLIRLNIWTPFTAMAQGNWSPFVVIALASLCNGFLWEFWNYLSSNPDAVPRTNPNYWIYNVPYVNVIHIHSEMPLLGYFGYLPFGVLVWVVFIWAGKVCGFNSDIDVPPASSSSKAP
jgi:hypothetical protein